MTQALTLDQLAISDFIEHEVVRVLTRKFQHAVSGIYRDPNDDPILEIAVAANADLLVAGDRDLLSLKSFQGIGIVTPMDYLRMSFPG